VTRSPSAEAVVASDLSIAQRSSRMFLLLTVSLAVGGAETLLVGLALGLLQSGWRVTVATTASALLLSCRARIRGALCAPSQCRQPN